MQGRLSKEGAQPPWQDQTGWSPDPESERKIIWIYRAVVGLLGAAAVMFIAANMQYLLNGGVASGSSSAYFAILPMAAALVIGVVVVAGTSYVIRTVRREAALAVEVERLRSKAKVADSLRELRHDFDNQLTVVLALLQMGNSKRAIDYLRGIIGQHATSAADEEGFEAFFGFLAQKSVDSERTGVRMEARIETWALPDVSLEALTRIAGNLIDNAVEAAASAREGPRVEVSVRAHGGRWELSVHNNGSHIEPHLLQKVFEAGFSTKGSGEGRGLGLAVVRRLVAEHAGSVDVTSSPLEGTRFTVAFPMKRAEEQSRDGETTALPSLAEGRFGEACPSS